MKECVLCGEDFEDIDPDEYEWQGTGKGICPECNMTLEEVAEERQRFDDIFGGGWIGPCLTGVIYWR